MTASFKSAMKNRVARDPDTARNAFKNRDEKSRFICD